MTIKEHSPRASCREFEGKLCQAYYSFLRGKQGWEHQGQAEHRERAAARKANELLSLPSCSDHRTGWEQVSLWLCWVGGGLRCGLINTGMKKLLRNQQRFEDGSEKAAKDCGRSAESWRSINVPQMNLQRKCGLFMLSDVDSSPGGLLWCGWRIKSCL